jgi:hypothetical protein
MEPAALEASHRDPHATLLTRRCTCICNSFCTHRTHQHSSRRRTGLIPIQGCRLKQNRSRISQASQQPFNLILARWPFINQALSQRLYYLGPICPVSFASVDSDVFDNQPRKFNNGLLSCHCCPSCFDGYNPFIIPRQFRISPRPSWLPASSSSQRTPQ